MVLLNFSHPFTAEMIAQVEDLSGHCVSRVITVPTLIDVERPIQEQVEELLDSVEDELDWQSQPYVVNLPALSVGAAVVLAELHGRTGFFPSIVRVGPVTDSTPRRFEVTEIVSLQAVRDVARRQR